MYRAHLFYYFRIFVVQLLKCFRGSSDYFSSTSPTKSRSVLYAIKKSWHNINKNFGSRTPNLFGFGCSLRFKRFCRFCIMQIRKVMASYEAPLKLTANDESRRS